MVTMFLTILFVTSLTIVSSLTTCENCIPLRECTSASQLISRDKSESTIKFLRKKICGYDSSVAQPKICCDNFDNLEIEGRTSDHHHVNLLPTDCGHVTADRLLGGYRVWDNEFPWVVRIAYRDSATHSYAFQCTGTVINSRYVLTLADCVIDRQVAGVRVGGRYKAPECKDDVCEDNFQDIQVSEHIIHPEFKRNSRILNNIGLLRLRNPVDLSKESAGVICLPLIEEHRVRNITGDIGTVSYWDETETEVQLKFPTSISPVERCNAYLNKHIVNVERDLLENSICAQRNDTKHCESVPGSPLMLPASFPDYKYLQYGILMTAKTECGPQIYTDVTKYIKWILDSIKS